MKTQIRKFLQEEDGITALEYGILAAIVAAVIVGIFHSSLKDLFDSLFGKLTTSVKSIKANGSDG